MEITVTTTAAAEQQVDILAVGIADETKKLPKELEAADALVGGVLAADLGQDKVKGKLGSTTWYRAPVGAPCTHLLVVGLGKLKDLQERGVRQAAYVVGQAATAKKAKSVAVQLFPAGRKPAPADVAGAIAEGAVLATFNPKNWATDDDDRPTPPQSLIVGDAPSKEAAKARKAAQRGQVLAEAANFVKFLQNEPANAMTPTAMATHAKQIAKEYGLEVSVLSKAQCEKLGMGSYLSVTNGSEQPPQFIVLKYAGKKSSPTLALVGKGVTFDTGGISLKPSSGMEEMKYDMSGAANVLGAMRAIAQLKPAVSVVGICPCTENMPSGKATKPGDIVTAMNGKTIEIINTDAEGRLILADALCYAVEKAKATQIVDLATLTGACVIALGHEYAAVMGNDAKWTKRVLQAAGDAGEKMWELPMDDRFGELIKSKIADIKNVGNRDAGTIVGAKFLQHFVKDVPWAHIDIAGVAWVDSPEPGMPKGPTGAPMRTLVTLAESL